MKQQGLMLENRRWAGRSVLECASPLALSHGPVKGLGGWPATPGSPNNAGRESARGLAHSKTWRQLVALFALVALALVSASAQPFAIDWFTVDGGGGTSTGGVFSVSGTIGQPDASGPMSGGNFSLTGGFWSLLAAVQTPGAPRLDITLTSTNTAVVSWPSPSAGFNLQQNTNLNTANWVAPTNAITDTGTIKFILVNPPSGNRFYRLFKP